MKYWQLRANKYNKIGWVTDKYLLKLFLDFCDIEPKDTIIEVGCGTGIIAKALLDKVQRIVVLDSSWDMLSQIQEEEIIVVRMNLEKEPIFIDVFNKIIARMVFHHIGNLPLTFKNCYQMLKEKGWLIIQEGIPPNNNKNVIDWTINLRNLKEKRKHFTKQSLIDFYQQSGFKNITQQKIINKNFSIKNWLDNSWKDTSFANQIYQMHLNAPKQVKEAYNMRILKNDIIIEAVSIMIKGQK